MYYYKDSNVFWRSCCSLLCLSSCKRSIRLLAKQTARKIWMVPVVSPVWLVRYECELSMGSELMSHHKCDPNAFERQKLTITPTLASNVQHTMIAF